MKRDPDIIRAIALAVEALPPEEYLSSVDGIDGNLFVGHVQLMQDAGLVEARIQKYLPGSGNAVVLRLTWAGQDFVSASRSDTLWEKAKKSVIANGTSWTFDLLKEWLKSEIKQGFPSIP